MMKRLLILPTTTARRPTNGANSAQRGSVLLEAMVAILIFSVGVLAIIGLQVASVRASGDAKYRAVASVLADELIGRMWATDTTDLAALRAAFDSTVSTSTAYTDWVDNRVKTELPVPTGVDSPRVLVNSADGRVDIEIYWLPPGVPSGELQKKHVISTYIR
jgi:type IV pilus assembly protein PilV